MNKPKIRFSIICACAFLCFVFIHIEQKEKSILQKGVLLKNVQKSKKSSHQHLTC